jgi:hypothetical protein
MPAMSDQDHLSSIAERVIELQKQWPDLVSPKPKEIIVDLLKKDLVHLAYENGRVVAACYLQPLNDKVPLDHPEQIFRVGGFAADRSGNVSKKTIFSVMKACEKQVKDRKFKAIIKNGNPVVAKFFKNVGCQEVSFSECLERYPEFAKSYLEKSNKSKEYYTDKLFCIYHPEFCVTTYKEFLSNG